MSLSIADTNQVLTVDLGGRQSILTTAFDCNEIAVAKAILRE